MVSIGSTQAHSPEVLEAKAKGEFTRLSVQRKEVKRVSVGHKKGASIGASTAWSEEESQTFASSLSLSDALGIMPTNCSTSWPPLKSSIVGIDLIPYFAATPSLSSTLTFVIFTLPSNSVASSSKIGAIALHGPHQGAQKSTSTGTVDEVIVSLKLAVVR